MIRAISIFFIILFFSCDNELVVNAEWEDIPVIYGILDPGYYNNSNLEENDNHYIRIQKSFLGNLAASQMAQEIDSIYYNPNDIVLSIDKLQNGVIVETFDLELVNNLDKLDGYFANESHQLYKFNYENFFRNSQITARSRT